MAQSILLKLSLKNEGICSCVTITEMFLKTEFKYCWCENLSFTGDTFMGLNQDRLKVNEKKKKIVNLKQF